MDNREEQLWNKHGKMHGGNRKKWNTTNHAVADDAMGSLQHAVAAATYILMARLQNGARRYDWSYRLVRVRVKRKKHHRRLFIGYRSNRSLWRFQSRNWCVIISAAVMSRPAQHCYLFWFWLFALTLIALYLEAYPATAQAVLRPAFHLISKEENQNSC